MIPDRDNLMTCDEAKDASLLCIGADPSLAPGQREAFEAHLLVCSACADEHEENKWLSDLLRRYGTMGENAVKRLGDTSYGIVDREESRISDRPYRPMTVEEGWEDLKRRCPSLAEACRRQERRRLHRRLFWRAAGLAAAASVLIAIGVGWLTRRGSDSTAPTQLLADSARVASEGGFAELVTLHGRQPLALDRPLTTGDEPQEILLGGMHRVVMNRNTKATFTTSSAQSDGSHAGKVPYGIQLAGGELYVEVLPGHPLTVLTPNARLEVTGTKFNVRAERERTELALLKGSVRFSQRNAASTSVAVTAGLASVIVGGSAPTPPREMDALAVTAWARDLALRNALARAQPDVDLHLLSQISDFWPQSSTPNLDSIDYVKWRDGHRAWFAREFPWIFVMQRALEEQHGVEADYIELLMVSGDIWQFHYPRPWDQPIPQFNPASVEHLAAHYGLDPEALLRGLGQTAVSDGRRPRASSLAASFDVYEMSSRRWQSDIASLMAATPSLSAEDGCTDAIRGDVLFFTLRAGTYLANTRTAAWLWLRSQASPVIVALPWPSTAGSDSPGSDTQTISRRLSHLQTQVIAAGNMGPVLQDLAMAPESAACETGTAMVRQRLAELASAFAECAQRP